jgi:hypothetical protein
MIEDQGHKIVRKQSFIFGSNCRQCRTGWGEIVMLHHLISNMEPGMIHLHPDIDGLRELVFYAILTACVTS